MATSNPYKWHYHSATKNETADDGWTGDEGEAAITVEEE